MKPIALLAAALLAWSAVATAQVPQLVSYQGRVAVGAVNFDGSGQFKFALVNADGSTTYWSNDGTSTAGSPPTAAVSLTVTKGLYSVLLGDTSLANMTPIPTSVWANADVRLRVWFNDGTLGSQLLTPDQRLAPSGYLPDGGVTSAKLANGAVGGAQIGNGAVGSAQLAAGAVTSAKLATGALASGQTASGNTQAVANTHYVATGTGVADHFDLPATANVGDTIQITGSGTGGWAANGTTSWTARESNRSWRSVASSADGSKLVAVVYGGQIYTNSLFGEPGSSVTLRYDGNGQWIPQQETQIATGAVGSSQIANGAVGATHIAAGAVTDDKLATPKVNRAGDTMTGLLTLPANGLNVGGNQLVAANDNVGIGANPPTARLDVVGGIKASGAEGFTFNSGDQDGGLFSPADGTLTFKTDGSERLRLAANGNVGINRIPTTNRLEVEGNASKSTAGDWLANSDRRIKEDILPVTGALDTLAKVRLVDFRYTEDYRATHPGVEDKRYLNVVAQEFAEVFPDHVQRSGEKLPDGSDILQVDTYPLTIYSAAAVQELKREKDAEVKALREENAGLRKESADLKERLDRLEKALLEGAAAR